MRNLFGYADRYIEESDWKTMAGVKFCLCALGIMVGVNVPESKKKMVWIGAFLVFLVTYVPLMAKLVKIVKCAPSGER